ncbi:amidase signature domain-containingprotein [Purpureocillium lavendulum]|uniref:Amidase signature domain-containingprotein n=1 Tax=Purpureocillium lavendulum TaxID=1247861 RepID=A0AB34FM38_9HYPO|nr:amidase signature domain-containingprotein [Purpureocillium lavendulum]
MRSLLTCLVAGSQYLIHPHKLGSIQETINPDAIVPVTLLETHEIFGDVDATLRLFDTYDDVFVPEFGAVLVEKPGPNATTAVDAEFTADGRPLYRLGGEVEVTADVAGLPSGPYFLYGPNLYQAWRLYDDDLGAFAFGVIPENVTHTTSFRAMSALSDPGESKSIAVPSRLYHHAPNARKPLNGIRVAIPDMVSLLGAVIVGKTKSSQFGEGREWVDEQAPWNPRGDGYQKPGRGAAGAGAGVAGYEWLKAAFGIDGADGVGEPATAQGTYSLRVTPSDVPLDGPHTVTPTLGSTGIVTRDVLELYNTASAVLSRGRSDVPTPPRRVVYPEDLFDAEPSKERRELMAQFVTTLENHLGIKAERIRLSALWEAHAPDEARGHSLDDYIEDVVNRSIGKKVSKSDYDEYQKRLGVFRRWFGERVINITDTEQGWTAMVLPCDSKAPDYRDEETIGRTEFHPVYGSIMGPRSGDLAVVHLVRRAFETARWRTRVDTGRFAFPVGDNGRHVDDRRAEEPAEDMGENATDEAAFDEL